MLDEYVSSIEETCGEERDVVVVLKYDKREEAIRKVLQKIEIEKTFSHVMTKGRYKNREISVYATGKLLVKKVKDKDEAEKILEELLG